MEQNNNASTPQQGPAIPPRPMVPSQPQRGTHQATIRESADLLKKLSEFNSKRDDLLKRLGEIGDKLQQRIDENGNFNAKIPFNDEMLQSKSSITTPPFASHHAPPPPPEFKKITFTRTREATKPTLFENAINIYFPDASAINDEWMQLANCEIEKTNDGVVFQPGNIMCIATGLKISVPKDIALQLVGVSGLSVISPALVTSHFKEDELVIVVKNNRTTPITLLYGVPLFTAIPIQLASNLKCDELLNSTYEDWIHGQIDG